MHNARPRAPARSLVLLSVHTYARTCVRASCVCVAASNSASCDVTTFVANPLSTSYPSFVPKYDSTHPPTICQSVCLSVCVSVCYSSFLPPLLTPVWDTLRSTYGLFECNSSHDPCLEDVFYDVSSGNRQGQFDCRLLFAQK